MALVEPLTVGFAESMSWMLAGWVVFVPIWILAKVTS